MSNIGKDRLKNGIWITWEYQVRNKSMADAFGVELYQFVYKGNRFSRYIYGICKTAGIINKVRPEVVFSENPSLVLNILLWFLKPIYGYKHVIDAHYAGVFANRYKKILQPLLNFLNRRANLVIVTNVNNQKYIQSIGGKSCIVEDPLPSFKEYMPKNTRSVANGSSILYICSFGDDEPYEEMFKAAELLSKKELAIHVTGNYRKAKIDPVKYKYLKLLGYIPYDDYVKYLFDASVVVDLTNREDCLVCGAYEAMEAEKPLVTSNSKALKEHFTAGTIFTENNHIDIFNSIMEAIDKKNDLILEIKQWKELKHMQVRNRIDYVIKKLAYEDNN
jgi:glycosyltransferase involved in cell wall biosynthesis